MGTQGERERDKVRGLGNGKGIWRLGKGEEGMEEG